MATAPTATSGSGSNDQANSTPGKVGSAGGVPCASTEAARHAEETRHAGAMVIGCAIIHRLTTV